MAIARVAALCIALFNGKANAQDGGQVIYENDTFTIDLFCERDVPEAGLLTTTLVLNAKDRLTWARR